MVEVMKPEAESSLLPAVYCSGAASVPKSSGTGRYWVRSVWPEASRTLVVVWVSVPMVTSWRATLPKPSYAARLGMTDKQILGSLGLDALAYGSFGMLGKAGAVAPSTEGAVVKTAATETTGGALVPMAAAVYPGTVRTVAGYQLAGTAGLVCTTYSVNVWGLYATKTPQGLRALVNALKAEAKAAGAKDISISGNAVVNSGIANMNPAIAGRYGLSFSQVNADTVMLQGSVP
ncbi:hypothetical protein NKJ51_30465 [Mesorhizobium sp. M0134]|uniref:hypothetical protein n=1 Tax=Mesorhizobium sp. M0134 TaxID=2956889 RepID=UPI00333A4A89